MQLTPLAKWILRFALVVSAWLILRPLIEPGLRQFLRSSGGFTPIEWLLLVIVAATAARARTSENRP
jgi:hypothetical protein